MFKSSLFVSFAASIFSMANAATLSGSARITPQDYYGLPASALANNPPACGMPYNELNLARITAVAKMDTSTTCGLCLKVVNSADTSKFIYVLAVDLGGSGLDLSIPSFEYLFGQRYDASPASWTTVASSYCNGIYTPGKVNNNQGIDAGSSSGGTTTVKTTSTKRTSTKKTTTKKTTTKKSTTKKSTTKKTTTTKRSKATSTKKTAKKTTKKFFSTKKSKTKATTKKTKTKSNWWNTTKKHRSHGDRKRRQH